MLELIGRDKTRMNIEIYRKTFLLVALLILFCELVHSFQKCGDRKYMDLESEEELSLVDLTNSDESLESNDLSIDDSITLDDDTSFEEGSRDRGKDKLYNRVKREIKMLDYRKPVKNSLKAKYPRKYFSFRGAEEHSADDLDLGLFEEHGGRRVIEEHRITSDDIYQDKFKPIKYRYAMGATSKTKYLEKSKSDNKKEIVLMITPKNFFANKDGKLKTLPTLALKVDNNKKVSVLLNKIKDLINSVYPEFIIEKIRHLKTKILLNEVSPNIKLNSLKIKNGDEISVTYKELPKKSKEYEQISETYEELLETPVNSDIFEDIEVGRNDLLVNKVDDLNTNISQSSEKDSRKDVETNLKDDLQEGIEGAQKAIDKRIDVEDNIKENTQENIDETKEDDLQNMKENIEDNINEDLNQNIFDDIKTNQEKKYEITDEEYEMIQKEKAIEAEKYEYGENIANLTPEEEINKCEYQVYYKDLYSSNKNNTPKILAIKKVTFYDTGPCRLESLINEVNREIELFKDRYVLLKLRHLSSKIDLLEYSVNKDALLSELGVINGDKISATIVLNIDNVSNISKEQELKSKDNKDESPVEDKKKSNLTIKELNNKYVEGKCITSLTIYMELETNRNKKKSGTLKINQLNTLNNENSTHKTRILELCIHSYITIGAAIKEFKFQMKIEPMKEIVFICGNEVFNSENDLPISYLDSSICILNLKN